MREGVPDDSGEPPPLRGDGRVGDRAVRIVIRRPGARRRLGHAAEETLGGPGAQENRRVGANRHEGGPAPQRPFRLRRLARKALLQAGGAGAAGLPPRAQRASRPPRRADRGAEIHQGLREVARPVRRNERFGERLDGRLGGRQRLLDEKETRDDPLDIAVDGGGRPVEGDGGDRRRRVGADAGQLAELRLRLRKAAAVQGRQNLCAGVEIARPRVIAEAGPGLHDGLDRRARQPLEGRKAIEKGREIGPHRRHIGLLQHDLRQPHPVGIRHLAGTRAPWQRAAMAVVPGQEVAGLRL